MLANFQACSAIRFYRQLITVMAGRRPGHPRGHAQMEGAWIYIVTNRPNGTLYTGVTSNLCRRIWEHVADGFTKQYGLKRLVYAEHHTEIRAAIQRERNMKHWPRRWKVRLILAANPNWDDLYDRLI
jgi:putative endonuclease